MDKQWYVFYTKSRHEKKVKDLLERSGYEVFLPMQVVVKQWSDRKKKVEVPLFNAYIFVRDTVDKIPAILQVPGMAWNIRYNGKPAVLQESEKRMIQRFLESGYFLEATGYEKLPEGTKVAVVDGPLKGTEGVVLAGGEESKLLVLLESIGQSISVRIDSHLLRRA